MYIIRNILPLILRKPGDFEKFSNNIILKLPFKIIREIIHFSNETNIFQNILYEN